MQILVNSDNSVVVNTELVTRVEANVRDTLDRFGDRITRVEVHLSDVNGPKSGNEDKRCVMEARPAGRDPVAATNLASTLDEAVLGAAQKLQRLLDSAFGRLGERS